MRGSLAAVDFLGERLMTVQETTVQETTVDTRSTRERVVGYLSSALSGRNNAAVAIFALAGELATGSMSADDYALALADFERTTGGVRKGMKSIPKFQGLLAIAAEVVERCPAAMPLTEEYLTKVQRIISMHKRASKDKSKLLAGSAKLSAGSWRVKASEHIMEDTFWTIYIEPNRAAQTIKVDWSKLEEVLRIYKEADSRKLRNCIRHFGLAPRTAEEMAIYEAEGKADDVADEVDALEGAVQ